jgi:4-amino-4-deoxy-L-arabinose transferase-like glycosyltransferase
LVPLLVFQMGVSAFGARAGLLAALAAAVQPELVAMSGYLYTETLFMFFSTAFLAFLWKGMEGGWNRDWALAGLWLGLSVSTRSLLFFFPPFLVGLFLVFRDLRRFAGRALWMSAVAGAVLVPWTVRNALAFHEFIPVSTGGGAEFWVGADIPNQGRYRYAETRNRILKLTENAPSEPEANRILIRQGLRNIAEDPWGWIRVCMLKAARFLVEVYENVPSGQSRQPNRAVTFVLVLGYYPLMILGLAGMWAARRIPRFLVPVSGFMLYTWILASLTLFVPRYRIPVLPLWCLFAGLCMDRVISVLQRRRNPEF